MRALDRAFAEQHAVVRQDRDRHPPDMREAAHQARSIERFELVELAAVDQPGDDLMYVVRRANVLRDDAVKILGGELWGTWLAHVDIGPELRLERRDDVADDGQRMLVIL